VTVTCWFKGVFAWVVAAVSAANEEATFAIPASDGTPMQPKVFEPFAGSA